MTSDDLIYGARSGIQKAIRRGDLDLCKTCFDLLWPEKIHRAWLKWRTPVLIGEEAYFFASEAAELLKSKSDDEAEWRKFLYRLTLVRKNKDAGGLWSLGMTKSFSGEENLSRQMVSELEQMRAALEAGGEDPGKIATDLFKELSTITNLTKYELDGMEVLKNRVFAGGMLGDRWILVAGMILLATRSCKPARIKKEEEWALQHWKKKAGSRKPRTIDLPWYVFDGHTQAGKIVLGTIMKHYGNELKFDKSSALWNVWFLMESGLVPDDLQLAVSIDEEAIGCVESSWWPLAREYELEMNLRNWENVPEFIEKGWPLMRSKLEDLVHWILEKRESRANA